MGKDRRQNLGAELSEQVMATTYIDTEQCPRVRLAPRQGTVAEILSPDLCGARNVFGMLRWLDAGERFDAESLEGRHQLIYLIEGDGVITLKGKDYEVSKGAGVYLGPCETASIRQAGTALLKLLHLVVRKAR